MGNSPHGIPNRKLGIPIASKIESSFFKNSTDRGLVLACYLLFPDNTIDSEYASLFHILLVTPKGVEMFCLLTGDKRFPSYTPPNHTTIVASVFSQDFIQSAHLILAESNGGFSLLTAYSLSVTKRIGLSHALPSLNATKNVIFTMISPAPEILYVGYLSGVVKVWHTAVTSPQFSFGKEYELPPVRVLCYSGKHRKLIVGYEGSFENQHGRFVKLEQNALRVFVPNASEEENECQLLEGFQGTCFSIALVERKDLVVAISSEDCGMFVWNLNTFRLELQLNLPRVESHPQIITQVLSVEMPSNSFLVLGTSDGSVLVSELEVQENKLEWRPLKKAVIQADGYFAVEFMEYNEKIDTLIVGNTTGMANLLSNFFADGLGVSHSVVVEQKIDEEIEN
jgi:hypothetical protein